MTWLSQVNVVEVENMVKIEKFEDLQILAGTSGWKNYLIFITLSLCKENEM